MELTIFCFTAGIVDILKLCKIMRIITFLLILIVILPCQNSDLKHATQNLYWSLIILTKAGKCQSYQNPIVS